MPEASIPLTCSTSLKPKSPPIDLPMNDIIKFNNVVSFV